MSGSHLTDIHKINVLFTHKLSHIFDVVLNAFTWKDCHDYACKTAAMNTADTLSNLIDKLSSQRKAEGNLLFFWMSINVTVLQKLKG